MDQYNNYIGLTLDGRYQLKRLVGEGGMAMVFEAEDLLKKTAVAVKILKEEFASDEVSVQRFINESKAVLMLSHSNIVKIFDISVKGENKYIVMEYIDGITLKSYIDRKGKLSVEETISYSIQILRALEHAHIGGIIHRDIKPQNIMLLRDGQIKVTDFGIAKLPDAKTLTATDKAIGTVYYISPEQAAGEKGIDRRTDLYSVGVMMYEMLTGKLPFEGATPVTIALKQINEEPTPPTELLATIPKGLEQIILFAMEKETDKRFQTATQMIELLQKVRENPAVIFRQKAPAKKKKGRTTMIPIMLGVAVAFFSVLVVCATVILLNWFSKDKVIEETKYTVESYVGKTFTDEFYDEVKGKYYQVKIEYEYSEEYEAGYIIRQDPAPGDARDERMLVLYVSQGTEELVMNGYEYSDSRQVENELTRLGLIVDDVIEEYNDVIPRGSVIKTIPGMGESVSVGDHVTIVVSKGEPVEMTVVPSFAGASLVEAYETLVRSDLRFGSPTYVYDEEIPKDHIVDQIPAAGTEVPKDVTKITFVISMGPSPVVELSTEETQPIVDPVVTQPQKKVPNCVGATTADAYRILAENGCEFGEATYEYSDTVEYGIIIRQSPVANSDVDSANNKVNFVISKGMAPVETTAATTTEPVVTTTEPEVTTTEPVVTTTEPEVTTTKNVSGPAGRFN